MSTDRPMPHHLTLRGGLAWGLMLREDVSETDVLAEVLRLARAANEHFDLLVRVADAWGVLSPYLRGEVRKAGGDELYDALDAISTFVSVHRKPAPPERNRS